ncbi:nitrate/nitrite transporter NrtS [Agarivorans litoreus]|uniref:nitrate/nitrite transporter NrtS n=1 Tax=Agarivorans litoreus TaxID=1510455 RepID=UPI001C7DC742|nr:nitrate/nitrite transporter NrtS [Agarivorans litoreus]
MNKKIFARALVVAVIVGSILNIINQWDIVNGASPKWGALLFTYCVPFLVSYFSGAMANNNKSASNDDLIAQLNQEVLNLESTLEPLAPLPANTRENLLSIKSLLKIYS